MVEFKTWLKEFLYRLFLDEITRKYVGYARRRHSCTKRFEIIISRDYGRAGCSIVRGNGEGRNGGRRRA